MYCVAVVTSKVKPLILCLNKLIQSLFVLGGEADWKRRQNVALLLCTWLRNYGKWGICHQNLQTGITVLSHNLAQKCNPWRVVVCKGKFVTHSPKGQDEGEISIRQMKSMRWPSIINYTKPNYLNVFWLPSTDSNQKRSLKCESMKSLSNNKRSYFRFA